MPLSRLYRALDGGDTDEIDEATAWINVLALYQELPIGARVRCLLYLGAQMHAMRDTEMDILEFHRATVQRAMALELRPDT